MGQKIGIGVDIGGSHIVTGAVNLTTAAIIQKTVFHKKIKSSGTALQVFKSWADPINSTLKSLTSDDEILGLGVAMPGAFNYRTGIALFSDTGKYNNLYGMNIVKKLTPHLIKKDLSIRFINDASAFAIGTDWVGESKEFSRSMVLTLGTGVGSAIINEGRPLTKGNHVPEHGCFWHLPYKNGIADDYFSTRWFVKRYSELTNRNVDGVKEIVERIGHDPRAQQVFDEFAMQLSELLTPWLRNLKIEVLVIGGNISKAFDYFAPQIQTHFTENGIDLVIRKSEMLESAALIGASKILLDDYWDSIKADLPEK